MTLAARLAAGRPTVSFELFPARSPQHRDAVVRKVQELTTAAPDFFSVTYGAAGGTGHSRELLAHVLAETPVTAMAHLTCVGMSRREVVDLAREFLAAGVRNVLALRGDPPAGATDWRPHPDGVHRACDLVELLQVADRCRIARLGGAVPVDEGPLSLAVAAFPSGGPGSGLEALRAKQDAGAHFAIAQVGYSAAEYARFVRRAREVGVTFPILPGIVPLTDSRRLLRLAQLTGVQPPRELLAALESAGEPGSAAQARAGTRFGRRLARELLDVGAPGLHLYTFNCARPALDLLDGLPTTAEAAPAVPAPAGPAPRATHPFRPTETAGAPAGGSA